MGGAVGASVTEKLWSVESRICMEPGSIWNSLCSNFPPTSTADQKKSGLPLGEVLMSTGFYVQQGQKLPPFGYGF